MINKNRILKHCLLLFVFWTEAVLAIDAPQDPRGTEVAQSLVKWEWAPVAGAEMYEIIVDGVNVFLSKDPQFFSFNLWAGEHSMSVRAQSRNGEYSLPTETVKIEVNDWFSANDNNRSFSLGQEPTDSRSTTQVVGTDCHCTLSLSNCALSCCAELQCRTVN